MAYQLDTLIGALGGSQQVTTATATLFGATATFTRVGNVVSVFFPTRSTGTTNPMPAGTVPVGFRPAGPAVVECSFKDSTSSSYDLPVVFSSDGSVLVSGSSDLTYVQSLGSSTSNYIRTMFGYYLAA